MRQWSLVFGLLGTGLAGCAADVRPAETVERNDSASVAIVRNQGDDRSLDWTFHPTLTLGGADDGPESFFRIAESSVTVDDEGNLYVLDNGNHRIVVFDGAGDHLGTMGREGGGPGEFQFWPTSIAIAEDGSINVYDFGKRGLVRFANDGTVLPTRPIALPLQAVRFTFTGASLVVQIADPVGETLHDRIVAVGADEDTTILASSPQPPMKRVDFGCVRIGGMPQIFSPSLVWSADRSRILVSAGVEHVIDVYEDGRRIASFRRDLPPRPATRELAIREIGEKFEVTFGSGGSCVVQPEKVVDERGIASVLPAISGIAVAPDGTIWVRRFSVKGDDPLIDLLGPDGTYLGTLPAGSPFPAAFMPDGRIVAVESDELDLPRIVVYRVAGDDPSSRRAERPSDPGRSR